ncbi:coiled-coil domain-containing protein 83-like [Amphiura filiformis]|uniref:coiled-coil domain-containing protein 83-like n=1 Tax=Amphiura filiformis TaxID=82378 RepID=UPI003B214860
MGKKGKKKGSGKKSGKKSAKSVSGKKPAEPQMTIREAIIAYQINVKEKALEDFMYEIKGLEETNARHKERNERLKEEQLFHIRNLLKQSKERDKELEQSNVVNKEQVDIALKEKWEAAQVEDKLIDALTLEIKKKEKEIANEKNTVAKWEAYKETGRHEHATHIKLLDEELTDMRASFDEMKGHLERTLNIAKDKIKTSTEDRLSEQKHIASQKAMTKLDKWSTQEVMDNDWLKREAELHRVETKQLALDVEELERQNLELMSTLFDCRIEDLKISRNFYLNQFGDHDNLEEDDRGLLESDLAKLDFEERPAIEAPKVVARKPRPASATQRAVEERVFALQPLADDDDDDDEEEEEDGAWGGEDEDEDLDHYLQYDDENFGEYLNLGPVELKLLRVIGHHAPLHHPDKLSDAEAEAKLAAPDVWPVTPDMLRAVTESPTVNT